MIERIILKVKNFVKKDLIILIIRLAFLKTSTLEKAKQFKLDFNKLKKGRHN